MPAIRLIPLALGAGLFLFSVPYATAQVTPSYEGGSGVRPSPELIAMRFQRDMKALREKALAQRAADGGQLTPTHAAAIQEELDTLQARHKWQLRRTGLYTVDSFGKPQ